jgi:hypothetical protein
LRNLARKGFVASHFTTSLVLTDSSCQTAAAAREGKSGVERTAAASLGEGDKGDGAELLDGVSVAITCCLLSLY